jgi:hypothetical protein
VVRPKLTAALDQMSGVMATIAPHVVAYHKHLCDAGMRPDLAVELARDYQRFLLEIATGKAPPPLAGEEWRDR